MSSDPVPTMKELLRTSIQFINVMPFTEYAIQTKTGWKWMTNIEFVEKLETLFNVRQEYVVIPKEEYEGLKVVMKEIAGVLESHHLQYAADRIKEVLNG